MDFAKRKEILCSCKTDGKGGVKKENGGFANAVCSSGGFARRYLVEVSRGALNLPLLAQENFEINFKFSFTQSGGAGNRTQVL